MKQVIKLLLIILLVMSARVLFAQKQGQALIDSVLNELSKAKEDTNKIKLLHELSYSYRNVNPDKGIVYGQQGLDLATKLGWEKGQATSNHNLGLNYTTKSDYQRALICERQALNEYKKIGFISGIASVLLGIGTIYEHQCDYATALDNDFKALKKFEAIGDKHGMAVSNGNIGIIFYDEYDYPSALKYFIIALKFNEEIGDKINSSGNLGNIGNVYMELGDYSLALDNYLKALKISKETGLKHSEAFYIKSIGALYHNQHNYAKAAIWNFKAFQMFAELGDKLLEARCLNGISENYIYIEMAQRNSRNDSDFVPIMELDSESFWFESLMFKGETKLLHKAVTCLKKAIAIEKEIGSQMELCVSYKMLATTDSLLGEYNNAYFAYIQYITIKDSIFSTESKIKITNLETQRMKDLKDKQIEIDKLEVEKKRNERVFYIAGIGLLLVVMGLTARSYSVQKSLNKTITKLVTEQEQTIHLRTKELAESNKRLIHANKKLVELIQYNAHNLREPLTRISGAMIIQEYITSEEFYTDVWPQMQKAVIDLDNSIKEVISIADETVNLYG